LKIQVLFFASLREEVGVESLALELQKGAYSDLRQTLIQKLGDAATPLWLDNVRLAHNQELIANATT